MRTKYNTMHDADNLHPSNEEEKNIKSTVIEETGNKEYPKIMRSTSSDLVVLFTERKVGTVIHPAKSYDIGDWGGDWDMDYFIDFEGSVTLTQ